MAQACDVLRIQLQAPATAAAATSTNTGALPLDKNVCAPAKIIAVLGCQQSVQNIRVKAGANSFRNIIKENSK